MTSTGSPPPPTMRRLASATIGAVVVAALVLFVAILPAEYGIDPLGTGRALGLMPPSDPASPAAPAPPEESGPRLSPTPVGPANYYGRAYSTDTAKFELGPYDYVEYKYRLEQGSTMTFAWKATATVSHDLHAEPDGGEEHAEVSFDKRNALSASGTYTAPFPGLHGWMWENPGADPITVSITTTGFYSSATEFRPNRRRIEHRITSVLP